MVGYSHTISISAAIALVKIGKVSLIGSGRETDQFYHGTVLLVLNSFGLPDDQYNLWANQIKWDLRLMNS